MKLLVSPTAFKGTLSPREAAAAMASAVSSIDADSTVDVLPLADGGDGTLEVLIKPLRATVRHTFVKGPLGKKVRARWGHVRRDRLAIIEIAEASGLKLVKRNQILGATTFGTGELIRAALDAGCRSILIGVGGTATADGGAGALQALGLRYFDRENRLLSSCPADLFRVHHLDWTGFDPRLKKTNIRILCDVTNPLLGLRGSARVFGPQKGATPSQVLFLEKFLKHWSRFAPVQTKDRPGSGAAGALAFGLSAFAGARLTKGAPTISSYVRWRERARRADVIITGEGRIDLTSFEGKVIGEIVKGRGRAQVWAVCGSSALAPSQLRKKGIAKVLEMGQEGLKYPTAVLKSATAELMKRGIPRTEADRRP